MATKMYGSTSLTGGGSGALDEIDGALLNDGDKNIVLTTTTVYHYNLNASSGKTENSPHVISPDSNAGNKRWELISSSPIGGQQNLITNSGFGCWSNSTLENVGAAIKEDDMADDSTADWTDDGANISLAFDTDHYEVTTNDAANQRTWMASASVTAGKLYEL